MIGWQKERNQQSETSPKGAKRSQGTASLLLKRNCSSSFVFASQEMDLSWVIDENVCCQCVAVTNGCVGSLRERAFWMVAVGVVVVEVG